MSILTFALTCKKEEENQSDHSPVQSRSRTGGAHCRARHFGAIFQLHGYPSDSYEASEPASSPTARARGNTIRSCAAPLHCHPLGVHHRGRRRLRLRLPIAINPNYVTVTIVNEFLGDRARGRASWAPQCPPARLPACPPAFLPARHPGNTSDHASELPAAGCYGCRCRGTEGEV